MSWPFLNSRFLNSANVEGNPSASPIRTADLGSAEDAALIALRDRLKALAALKRATRLEDYRPYPKQLEFHALGAAHRERLFMAGNQLGKTWSGGAEAAYHATGLYPDWWTGRRFDRPTVGICGGVSGELVREGPQRILCGRPGDPEAWGTGMIPHACLLDKSAARGVADLIDGVSVRHVSGGTSRILFKAYQQGRVAWQAQTVDWVWFDEEPPLDVYTEGLTRSNTTQGPIWLTFTPLLGMSLVVSRFLSEQTPGRTTITMTIHDAAHYTPEQRAAIIASYPAHERKARAEGIPMLGSGAIFPVPDEAIVVPDFPVPRHWPRIGGMDFGWDHPFAAVELAWDRDADVVYVVRCWRRAEATPLVHVEAIKPWGRHLRWAWPHDGLQHDKGSGEQLAYQYRKLGLKTLPERATFADGSNGVEAGLADMLGRMETGRWKVFASCTDWLDERRLYHRKDGKIVKLADDLLSASRYALMMLRHARVVQPDDAPETARVYTPEHDGNPFRW
jgi:phage terminase large subunit-like protein